MQRTSRDTRSGFTMAELALALGIIGLLVGGILAGQNLQRVSQVRSLMVDAKTYSLALQQFKQQYKYLPGDFPFAVRIWGKADGDTTLTTNCATPNTDNSAGGVTTCNGDGNGRVTTTSTASKANEPFRAWQHLAAAGYVNGTYTGVAGASASTESIPGQNVPGGKMVASTFMLDSLGIEYDATNTSNYYDANYDNVIIMGKQNTGRPTLSLLTPKEAYDIDKKSDDGLPGYGYIMTYRGRLTGTTNGLSCVGEDGGDTASVTAANARYRRDEPANLCFLFFMYGYGVGSSMK